MALADLKRVAERLGYGCVDCIDFHWFLRSKHEVGKYASLSKSGSLCSQICTEDLRVLLDAWESEETAEDRLIRRLEEAGYSNILIPDKDGECTSVEYEKEGTRDVEYFDLVDVFLYRVVADYVEAKEKEGAGGCG